VRGLLISYHFPPSNAAGAHRWDAFTRYGAARGWNFDVITAAGASSGAFAEHSGAGNDGVRVWTVAHDMPAVVRMVRDGRRRYIQALRRNAPVANAAPASAAIGAQVIERADLAKGVGVSRRARRAVNAWMVHHEYAAWVRDVVSRGLRIASTTRFDCVISSGPPHMSHEAARRLARALGVPLVLDFRDPWSLMDTLLEYMASPTWYRIAAAHERRCVSAAKLVVMNTELATERMQAAYPTQRIVTVRNGYDGERVVPSHDDRRFQMTYAGAIYLDRDPRPILAALARVVKAHTLTSKDVELSFIGDCESYGGVRLVDLAQREGLDGIVQVLPQVPRAELRKRLASAAMLINLPQGAKLCIPSKVYEYLHFPAWVLALEPDDSATALVLRGTGADVVRPDDIDAIAAVVANRFREYAAGARPEPIAVGDRFSVTSQAELFFQHVSKVLGRRDA
jgi:hypothetical protein